MKLTIPAEHWQWLEHGTARVEMAETPAQLAVLDWLEAVPDRWLLVLASEGTGSGKSLAAAWALTCLEELRDGGHPRVSTAALRSHGGGSWWCQVQDLATLESKRSWEKEERLKRIRDGWVVVLDDVGTEKDPGQLADIIAHRRGQQLLTIATTNLVDSKTGKASKEWRERYDRRLLSRMTSAGDHERGKAIAWCHVPHDDLRSRTTPRLLPPGEERLVAVGDEIDVMLARIMESTDPKRAIARSDKTTRERWTAEAVTREANRRKVWGSLALDELAQAAMRGDERACDLLDNVARRAAGGTTP
jgi:hypothetical protein